MNNRSTIHVGLDVHDRPGPRSTARGSAIRGDDALDGRGAALSLRTPVPATE